MVWNLSKVDYDAYMLDDMVLSYKFLGSPSPPLGLLPKLLMAIESWLKANSRNVAMVHCLTGRGRTSTVLAAFLCWMGVAGFHDINNALSYIVRCKRLSIKSLTIPSQVRYAGYFANMLNGVRPSSTPLTLKRIIMSKAPKFGRRLVPTTTATSCCCCCCRRRRQRWQQRRNRMLARIPPRRCCCHCGYGAACPTSNSSRLGILYSLRRHL